MHLSLRWRVIISYSVLFLIAMIGLNLFLSFYVRATYQDNLRTYLMNETRIVANEAQRLWSSPVSDLAWRDLANRYSKLLNARVTLIYSDGTVLGESSQAPDRLENHKSRPEVISALANKEATEIRFSDTLNQELIYSAAPIMITSGEIIGVARLAVSLSDVQQSVSTIGSTILIAALITVVITVILAYFLTSITTFPLRRLTQTVVEMGGSQTPVKSQLQSFDEVSQLEQAFNNLAHQLQSRIDELSAEHGKLETVLSSMADGVLIVNPNGNIELTNQAVLRMFNVTDASVIGKSLIEIIRNHLLVELWRKCRETGEQQITQLETSPERLFVQVIATPLAKNMPGTSVIIFQDLTKMRRLELVRRDFVSNVSHELRTPLASLKALTETLQEGALEDPPAAQRFLLRMEHEIDNLTQMVQELLELSRIESGKVPLKKKNINPCELASPAVERMMVQAERAGLQLKLECPIDLPNVFADQTRMEQVLVNLIHNAIKFTLPGGEIVVHAQQERNMIVFSVHDTGAGISSEVLPRIFERFYKADRSRSGGGTGLGLSIARHMVEAHGGRIWAESELGKGSTFFYSIPVAQ